MKLPLFVRKSIVSLLCVMPLLASHLQALPLLNGSFESGTAGWTASGNISVQSAAPYVPTQGGKLVAFNAGNSAPNGVLSQTLEHRGGGWLKLSFDVGNLSYVNQPQKLGVKATEITDAVYTPLSEEITVPALSGGKTRWVSKELIFTTRTHPVTITFRDLSQTTNSLDLVLDNVRLVQSCLLQVQSNLDIPGGPAGVVFESSPGTIEGFPNDQTPDGGHYFEGTVVTLTAPATASGRSFVEWQKNGVSYSTSRQIAVVVEDNVTFKMIYQIPGMVLTPDDKFITTGPAVGGPFLPEIKNYYLTNNSGLTSEWSATTQVTPLGSPDPNWLSVTPKNGVLLPGQYVEIRVGVGAFSSSLAPGNHQAFLKIFTPFGDLIRQAEINVTPPKSSSPIANAGFESGLSGWEASGNVAILSDAPYIATEGSKLAAFNTNNSAPNGSLRQIVPVVPGYRQYLRLDLGNISGGTADQILRVVVRDFPDTGSPIAEERVPISGSGNGTTKWVTPNIVSFIPAGNHVTIILSDASDNTQGDLLVDNVRLVRPPPFPLSNGSFEEGFDWWGHTGNVALKSQPPYLASAGNWLAVFNAENSAPGGQVTQRVETLPGHPYQVNFDVGNLSYNNQAQRMKIEILDLENQQLNSSETFDVPGTTGGATSWLAKSHAFVAKTPAVLIRFTDISQTTNSVDLVLDNVTLLQTPLLVVVGGGFENGLANWYATGNVALGAAPSLVPAEGSRLIVFNSGNSTPNGTVTQNVATVPDQPYRLDFKAGNIAFNRQSQRIRVQVSGRFNGVLQTFVSQIVEITAPQNSGGTRWIPASFLFTPSTDYVTITFTDVSTGTVASDLLLDDVKITR